MKSKRKILPALLSTLMVVCALVSGAVSAARAESGAATATRSIDAVIVLDNSSSMDKYDKNDAKGYRIDATQMFISMCDMNGSRVAVVPFTGDVLTSADPDFVDISTAKNREAMIEKVEKLRNDTGPDTNLGKALSVAVQMVFNRTDAGNAPLILVLTDGQTSITNPISVTAPLWNGRTFAKVTYTSFTKADSDALQEQAVAAAESRGIPIYTIPLYKSSLGDDDVRKYYDPLKKMSAYTNGVCTPINSTNADTLPRIFGDMLATQIGSEQISEKDITPSPVAGSDGLYEVELPILNNSVMEANVYIPLTVQDESGVEAASVRLYDAAGNDVSVGDGTTVIPFESENHFRLYKIRSPKSQGVWKLQYRVTGDDVDPTAIAFSILYNYNIQLKTFAGPGKFSLTSGDIQALKSAMLTVQSEFYDNATDTRSTDANLYQEQSGKDWYTIRGRYEFRDSNNALLFSGDLTSDHASMFSTTIDLAHVYMDINGNNRLKAGRYQLNVTVEGAGLRLTTTQPVTLGNSAPVCSSSVIVTPGVTVDDPGDPATQEPQPVSIPLSRYFTDADNDKLDYDLVSADGAATPADASAVLAPSARAADIVNLKIVGKDDGVYAEGVTVRDASTGLFHYGAAHYTLTVDDGDAGGLVEVPLTVNVVNRTIANMSAYRCDTATEGVDAGGTAPKNSDVTFTMTLLTADGGLADTTGAISAYGGTVDVYDAGNTSLLLSDPQMRDMRFNDTKTALSYTFTTGNTAREYQAVCQYFCNGIPTLTETFVFRVVNTPPSAVADALAGMPEELTFRPLPNFLSFLGQVTPVGSRTVDMEPLFTETDNERLQIRDPVVTDLRSGKDGTAILSYQRDGDAVVFTPLSAGDVKLTLTAVDGDGRTAVVTRSFRIVDLTARWIHYGIFLVAGIVTLIALWVFIHRLRKPVYPNGAVFEAFKGAELYPYTGATQALPSDKKKVKSVADFIAVALAGECGIDTAKLTGLKIRPMRNAVGGSIEIKWAKIDDTYPVRLNGAAVGDVWQTWNANEDLEIRPGDGSIRLRLVVTEGAVDGVSYDDGLTPPAGGNGGGFGGFGGKADDGNDPDGFGGFGGAGGAPAESGSRGGENPSGGFGGFDGDAF